MNQTELIKVKGIGEKTAEKLLQGGIESIGSLIEKTAEEVSTITGFGLKRVEGLMDAARELVAPEPPTEAAAASPKKKKKKKKKKSERSGKKKKKGKKSAKGKKKKGGKKSKKAKGKTKKSKKKKKKGK